MPRNWKEMDTGVLEAPPGWTWDINDRLAHYVWNKTAATKEVGWGPDPPLLLEALTGTFPSEGISAARNSWYLTRVKDRRYQDHTVWHKIPTKFSSPEDRTFQTDILYSETQTPHPFRSTLHSQQYTATGAMFTYEFRQWQGETPGGFMRIPVPEGLLDDLRNRIEALPFEETQYQSRGYREQFSEGLTPSGTFPHPHFSPIDSAEQTYDDYKDLFDVAFEFMKRGTRMERG